MATSQPPVIFLAFANDRDDRIDYLRDLPRETRLVREALTEAARHDLCELVVRTNVTVQEIFDVFQDARFRDRVAIFHFGGHAEGYELLFESPEGDLAPVNSEDLARFLGQQRSLELVFLNACATQPQADDLRAAGVSVVIATTQLIDDEIATEFSASFYTALASGVSIRTSYNEATAAIQAQRSEELFQLYRQFGADDEEHWDDRWPWNIYLRDGAEIAARWNLPDAVGNPLFGLPKPPTFDLPAVPYRHLSWFQRQHSPVFFGRGYEISELFQRVMATDSAPIVLYYGQSGVGKSSLLAAGLLPRLEADYLVRYARRDPVLGLQATLCHALDTDEDPFPAWQALEREADKPLIMVLDQAEELFTRPRGDPAAEMQAVLDMLQQIFAHAGQRPQGKLVLSFRKEWLADFESHCIKTRLPYAKVYLQPLTRRGIVEAVEGPTHSERLQQHYGLTVDDGLADLIAGELSTDPDSPIAPVLQILLTRMWRTAVARDAAHPHFDFDLYQQMKRDGILLDDFLAQQLDALHDWRAETVESGLVLDLLAAHTTPLGAAARVEGDALANAYGHQNGLPALVQQCVDLYLLIYTSPEEVGRGRSHSVQLAHDTLAPLVRKRFDESDAPGQHARRILENRVVNWRHADGGQDVLDDVDLAAVERGETGMRTWTADERSLVEASRQARASRHRRRRFWQSVGVAAMALIVSVAIIAFVNWKAAAAERDRAWRNDSLRLANLALQILPDDPVSSVQLASIALGADGKKRPYVARAEYVLAQSVRAVQEQRYLETGLQSSRQIAFGPEWIAVGGEQLRLVRDDLSESVALPGEYKNIEGVAWSDDGRLLAYGDQTLYLWDGLELTSSRTFDVGRISCAAWRPQGGEIAVCAGQSVLIWDPTRGPDAVRTVVEDIDVGASVSASQHDAIWSPDGRWLALWGMNLGIWDDQRGEMMRLELLDDPDARSVDFAVWSPDGRWLVSGWGEQLVRLWPVGHGVAPTVDAAGVAEGARFLPTDDGGYSLLIWGQDGYLARWRKGDEAQWTEQRFTADNDSYKDDTFIGVALDSDQGRMVAYSDAGFVYMAHPGQPALPITLIGRHEGAAVHAAAWHGDYVATGGVDGAVWVWDVAAPRAVTVLTGRQKRVLGVRWIDDENLLSFDQAVPGEDIAGSLRMWRIFDEEGKPLCTRSSPDQAARCRSYSRPAASLTPLDSDYERIRWLADGTILATDGTGAVIKGSSRAEDMASIVPAYLEGVNDDARVVWNPAGDALLRYIPQSSLAPDEGVAPGELWRSGMGGWHRAGEIPGPISGASWLSAGLLIGRPDDRVELMDPESGQTMLVDEAGRVQAVDMDDDRIALISSDKRVHIWDVATQRQLPAWTPGDGGAPLALAAIPRGRGLLAVFYDGERFALAKWEADKETWQWVFPDFMLEIGDIRSSPDARFVGIVLDGLAYVIDTTADGRYWVSPDSGYILGLGWHPSGTEFVTWSWDDEARIWKWDPDKLDAELVDRVTHQSFTVEPQFGPDGRTLLTIGANDELMIWRLWTDTRELLDATQEVRDMRGLSPAQREQFSVAMDGAPE